MTCPKANCFFSISQTPAFDAVLRNSNVRMAWVMDPKCILSLTGIHRLASAKAALDDLANIYPHMSVHVD